MNYGMLAYGRATQPMKSGDDPEWGVVALASQKNYISLYLGCLGDDTILLEKNKARLGKVSVGKCCIRFKKLEHLNPSVAMELVKKAAEIGAAGQKR